MPSLGEELLQERGQTAGSAGSLGQELLQERVDPSEFLRGAGSRLNADEAVNVRMQELSQAEVSDPVQPAPAQPFRATREAAASLGAQTGAMLGLPAAAASGPLFPLVEMGAAGLGGAAGYLMPDTIMELGKVVGFVPEDAPTLPRDERLTEAVKAGGLEALFQGAGHALLPISDFAASLVRRAAGVGPKQLDLARKAKLAFNIDLDVASLSPRAWAAGFRSVAGPVPLIGAPFRDSAKRLAQQTEGAANSLVLGMAPPEARGLLQTYENAPNLMEAHLNRSNTKYENFLGLAAKSGVTIDPVQFRKQAGRLKEVWEKAQPSLTPLPQATVTSATTRRTTDVGSEVISGKPGQTSRQITIQDRLAKGRTPRSSFTTKEVTTAEKPRKSGFVDPLEKTLNDAMAVTDGQSVEQIHRFVDRLTKERLALLEQAEKPGALQQAARLKVLRDALRADLRAGVKKDPGLAGALQDADTYLLSGTDLMTPESLTRLFDDALVGGKMESLKELRTILGKDGFKEAVATRVDNSFKAAIDPKTGRLDKAKLQEALGLTTNLSREQTVLKRAFGMAGVNAAEIVDFLEVAEKSLGVPIQNFSTFLARRTGIAGISSAMAFLPGYVAAGGLGGLASSIALATVLRGGAHILTDPKILRLAKTSVRQDAELGVRRAATIRMYDLALRILPKGATEGWETPDQMADTIYKLN